VYYKRNLIVVAADDQTGTQTITEAGVELALINRGLSDLVITINGMAFTIPSGANIDEAFRQFTGFSVAGTGAWSYMVRQRDTDFS